MRIAGLLIGLCLAVPAAADPAMGERGYLEHCAECHEGGVPKAPHKMFLEMMAPDAIHAAMTDGIMSAQASQLSPEEKIAVAEYLAKVSLADYEAPALPPACGAEDATFDFGAPSASKRLGRSRTFSPTDRRCG